MSENKVVRLGDVCKFKGGINIDRSLLSENEADGKPIVLHTDIEEGQVSTYYTGDYSEDQIVHNGEYLISLTDCLSIEEWEGDDALYSHHFCRIVPDPEKLDPTYMFYALSYIFDKLENEEDEELEEDVTVEDLATTEIILPGLDRQQLIAGVISNAYDLVSLEWQQIDKAEELLDACFVELFGQVDVNDRNWEVKPLGALADRISSRSLLPQDRKKGEHPYYDSTGIVDHIDNYLFDEELVLVAKVGSVLTSGSGRIAKAVSGKIWPSDLVHTMRIKPDAGIIPEYLEVVINGMDISSSLRGGVMPKLPKAALNELQIPVPPLELQLEYRGFLHTISEQCIKSGERLDDFTQICDSLNDRFFGKAMSD